ncbi:hypothetical protein E3N88_26161 [Mikania micrantha]|uniref:Myb/SANT-like domain-containing protein n=1 Tax=Mikania micrantha TaxID=192012 RepID=A0A5N6N7U0_9ASTR|nr:hypothetical protein E3N88_26161 [Mikania micrantha]
MSGGSAIKTWLLVASIGAVEALKDQGVARWNGPLKALQNHAKSKIVSSYNKSVADRASRSLIVGSELAARKYRSKATSMQKVMDMNCFGPSTNAGIDCWEMQIEGSKLIDNNCFAPSRNKKGPDFWSKIRNQFFQAMGHGEYRTNDMLSSKWRDMNQKVRKFNGIYSQKWQTRRSGQSDAMIELESEDQYREEFNAPFTLKWTPCLFKKERVPLTERKTLGIDSQWPMRKTSPLFLLFFLAFGLFYCPTQYLKIDLTSLEERGRKESNAVLVLSGGPPLPSDKILINSSSRIEEISPVGSAYELPAHSFNRSEPLRELTVSSSISLPKEADLTLPSRYRLSSLLDGWVLQSSSLLSSVFDNYIRKSTITGLSVPSKEPNAYILPTSICTSERDPLILSFRSLRTPSFDQSVTAASPENSEAVQKTYSIHVAALIGYIPSEFE